MKNKYNIDFNIKNKKLKNFRIDVGIDYFICSSDFLTKDKGLNFLKNTQDTNKRKYDKKNNYGHYTWYKKVIEKSDIIMNTHFEEDTSIFLGNVSLNKKDHFFILEGDSDARWFSMPPLGFFKYVTIFKRKLSTLNCKTGKISFFSDRYINEEFKVEVSKNKKFTNFCEFNVTKGKYILYSMNIETEEFKKTYPYSNVVGALLVKE